jgi:hypothetical protein
MGQPARKALSLEAYLQLEEKSPIRHHLVEGNQWTYLRLGPGEKLPLPCPTLELAVDDLYRGVNLEEG